MDVSIDKYGFKSLSMGYVSDNNISEIENIHHRIVFGIKKYFENCGGGKAILGLSGGIDSALVAALAVEALGCNRVVGVLLPSQYSSEHSVNDAVRLANNLGIEYMTIPIERSYNAIISELAPIFDGTQSGVAEENLQARVRGMMLMTIANKFGYILLNTSNKSESAVGYGTIYGDMCGGIAVIGSLYKGQVYELSNYINRDAEIIPYNSITKPPSAELRPDQKDTDSLPEYEVLDAILNEYIENGATINKIIEMGFDGAVVNKCLNLLMISEWKRLQAAPSL